MMNEKCPKCHSDLWKSAKLLILEGTTNTEGKLDGELVTKGSLSTDARDYFLADRWFSYESPLNAEISSTTTSVLVDEIKNMLVTEASIRPMPLCPSEPLQIAPTPYPKREEPAGKSFFSLDPSAKKLPKEPKEPEDPVKMVKSFEPRSWFSNYLNRAVNSFLWILLCVTCYNYFFPQQAMSLYKYVLLTFDLVPTATDGYENITTHLSLSVKYLSALVRSFELDARASNFLALFLTILLLWGAKVLLHFPASFKTEQSRKKKYQKKIEKAETERKFLFEKYDDKLLEYKNSLEQREAEIKIFQAEHEASQSKLEEYNASYDFEKNEYDNKLKQNEAIMAARKSKYLEEFSNYEAEMLQVKAFRNELWDRARMCTRCGSMYMGQRSIQSD